MREAEPTGVCHHTSPELDRTVKAEAQALVRAIRRSRGFGLFLVVCDLGEAAAVVQRLQPDLKDTQMSWLQLENAGEERRLVKRLQTLMLNHSDTAIVWVTGLENGLTTPASNAENRRVFSHLNQQREWFRDQLAVPLVFVMPGTLVTLMIRQAPDFFDWRSGLFDLSAPAR